MSLLIYTIAALIVGLAVGVFLLKKETKITTKQRWTAVSLVGIQIAATSFILIVVDQMINLNTIIGPLIYFVVFFVMNLVLSGIVGTYLNKVRV